MKLGGLSLTLQGIAGTTIVLMIVTEPG